MSTRRCALLAGLLLGTLIWSGDAQIANPPKEEPKMLTGHCHCGQITYEIRGAIVNQSYCDCPGCRRATGTLKVPFVSVLRKDLRITGEPKEFRSQSGAKCDAHGIWLFCPNCGTHLFWKNNDGEHTDVFVGTLDDPKVFQPKEK